MTAIDINSFQQLGNEEQLGVRRAVLVATTLMFTPSLTGCGHAITAPVQHRIGAYLVKQVDQDYVDTSRRTPPNTTSYPGSSVRALKVTLYIPRRQVDSNARFPLIVFAPGFTALPADYDSVEEVWASAGYLVAGIQFPLSTRQSPGGATLNDIADQPGDVKFVISHLLQLSRQKGDPVLVCFQLRSSCRWSLARSGHDLGADRQHLLPRCGPHDQSCCHHVGLSLHHPGWRLLPQGRILPPMLSISGSKDPLATPTDTNRPFAQYPSTKYQSLMLGGPHVDYVAPWETALNQTIVAFLNLYLAGTGSKSAVLEASTIPGLARRGRPASCLGRAAPHRLHPPRARPARPLLPRPRRRTGGRSTTMGPLRCPAPR